MLFTPGITPGPSVLKLFVQVVSTLRCDVAGDGGELRPTLGVGLGAELPDAGGGAVQLGALLLVRQHPPGRDHNNKNKLNIDIVGGGLIARQYE